jgi:hypothetical protein
MALTLEDPTKMSKVIGVSAAILPFVSVGIGLWDGVRGLGALAAGGAVIFVISAIVNSWAG